MKRFALYAALPLAALALTQAEVSGAHVMRHSHPAHSADQQFQALSERFLAAATKLSPVEATALGEHRYDSLMPDISPAGRLARRQTWHGMLGELARLPAARLSRDHQVDLALLRNELQYRIWQDQAEQGWAWNAQLYNDAAAGSLYTLAARDFAPWDVRLRSATARMTALPAFLKASRSQLVPARVPLIFAQTVSKQNAGIAEVAEGMLAPHADALSGADRAAFDKALAGLKLAVADQQVWLDTVLVPAAKGDFRLGARLYDQKMHYGLMSNMTRPELKARAVKAMADTRAEMYAVSRGLLAGRSDAPAMPAQPSAAQQQAVIAAALALSYAKHPPRAQLEQRARETLTEATAFVAKAGFVRMPDGPVKVITMPKFQQGNSVAYNDPPGLFEKGQQNFYAVSPIPDDWTDAQAASFLSEYNEYMIHDLSIHEAMPGHYLQLDHSNRSPDLLRAYLGSGPFVEGWAVYAEGMMKDEGYLASDPLEQRLFQLTVLKMRLRSISNTLLDIGIHTERMTREQAMELMQHDAFQAEREAAGKWVRASLSSVQLLSYFTGFSEHTAMREEAKQRWGNGYTLRRYNDQVLSYGSPPVKYVRDLMFGLPIR